MCMCTATAGAQARPKFVMELTVIVTWTGTFSPLGYVPGRLSAALYREHTPLAVPIPGVNSWEPVGFAPIGSAALCTLTSMGRFVIR